MLNRTKVGDRTRMMHACTIETHIKRSEENEMQELCGNMTPATPQKAGIFYIR